jgi:isopenicillin N synthase-like dioxygenase
MLDGTQVLPKPVQDGNHTVLNYLRESDNIAKTILRNLASQLGGDFVDIFENAHADSDSTKSITILGLLRYPKGQKQECGHNMHTDAGTITLLLTQQWGLQILDPQTREWQYVEPKPGFAIVNVGDSLRFLSAKRLSSAVHRVLPQEDTLREDRFSICYFLRPNDDVLFPDQDGKMTISAQEWYVQKFKTFKQTHEEQATESFLTGGMQFTMETAV